MILITFSDEVKIIKVIQMRVSLLLLLATLAPTNCSPVTSQNSAAYDVLIDSLPDSLSSLFNLTLCDSEATGDYSFTHKSEGGVVIVEGSSGVALTAGALDWLKIYANVSISWDATGGKRLGREQGPRQV